MNWLQHAQHERSTNLTAEQQTCGQEHEVRKTAKAKEQLRVKEERRKKEEREREELEADLERARLLADREKEEEEKEKEREAEARTIAFQHRQLADAGLLPICGEMWKLGKAWRTGGMVRLWHKYHFLLQGQNLAYFPTQEALLKSSLLRKRQVVPYTGMEITSNNSCTDMEVATPRCKASSKSQPSTPRSLVSRLSESISSPRSWYSSKSGAITYQPTMCQLSGRWVFTLVDGGGRNHHFACTTEELRQSWMTHLQRAAKMLSRRDGSEGDDSEEGDKGIAKVQADQRQEVSAPIQAGPGEEEVQMRLTRQDKSVDVESARRRARQSPPPTIRPPSPPKSKTTKDEARVGTEIEIAKEAPQEEVESGQTGVLLENTCEGSGVQQKQHESPAGKPCSAEASHGNAAASCSVDPSILVWGDVATENCNREGVVASIETQEIDKVVFSESNPTGRPALPPHHKPRVAHDASGWKRIICEPAAQPATAEESLMGHEGPPPAVEIPPPSQETSQTLVLQTAIARDIADSSVGKEFGRGQSSPRSKHIAKSVDSRPLITLHNNTPAMTSSPPAIQISTPALEFPASLADEETQEHALTPRNWLTPNQQTISTSNWLMRRSATTSTESQASKSDTAESVARPFLLESGAAQAARSPTVRSVVKPRRDSQERALMNQSRMEVDCVGLGGFGGGPALASGHGDTAAGDALFHSSGHGEFTKLLSGMPDHISPPPRKLVSPSKQKQRQAQRDAPDVSSVPCTSLQTHAEARDRSPKHVPGHEDCGTGWTSPSTPPGSPSTRRRAPSRGQLTSNLPAPAPTLAAMLPITPPDRTLIFTEEGGMLTRPHLRAGQEKSGWR